MYINEEKKEWVKEITKLNKGKRNINAKILKIIKDDIEKLLNKGFAITDIQAILNKELKRDFEYRSLAAWIKRNIKDKSNKGVKNVKTKEINKKEKKNDDKEIIPNNSEADENNDTVDLDEFKNQLKNLF